MFQKIIITFLGLLSFPQVFAQIIPDTTKNSEKYNPDLIIQNDTTSFMLDSIALRQEFMRDSLIAREEFVKDSLFRRKQILDSLIFLREELPRLIAASIKSTNENIIIFTGQVNIIEDSTLSDFTYSILSQKIDKPYAPWRTTIKLSGNSLKLKVDTINKKLSSVRLPGMSYSFDYNTDKNIVRMNGRKSIIKKQTGNYYKYPIDSVFFNRKGSVKRIKKYVHYFEATKDYKKGASFSVDIEQIKEFEYFPDGVLSSCKIINYCDGSGGTDTKNVCHTVTYSITRRGRNFTILRKSEPKNDFSDGTFTYEFDDNFDMKRMEFTNANKSLSRNCIIELNKDKNVSRYLYEKNGRINKTLLISYNDDPNAKHKFETTLCYFEEDGISYYQKNTTTGKSRSRNKLTMKWNPWK